MGRSSLPDDELELWGWVRNPLPLASEGGDFEVIRRSLRLPEGAPIASGSDWQKLAAPDRARIHRMARDLAQRHNPFIRHIVRRTRDYLETIIDPETSEPYLKPVTVELFGDSDEEAIGLPPYLRDAYSLAEEFCQLLAARVKGSGFLKTLLLRRVGSTIYAGRNTAEDLLESWREIADGEDEDEESLEMETLRSLTPAERAKLQAFVDALEANQERDPKYNVVRDTLVSKGWLDEGCIIFSQYFDSIWWLTNQLSQDMPQEIIGTYAGGPRSVVLVEGAFSRKARDELKQMVRRGELRLLLGTDAASEGLNLQCLGTLMNLELPWNPTRLEQRKGRIQRIGQLRNRVLVYNMRYKGSVKDRVHQLLSNRLEGIFKLFGQLPDVLEDVWIDVALGQIEQAKMTIDAMPRQHPFAIKYHEMQKVPWESCTLVLDSSRRKDHLLQDWPETI